MSRPRIGVNCNVADGEPSGEKLTLNWPYVEAVVRGGGLPVLLPPVAGDGLVAEALAGIDGLVLIGGRDYDPALYGQERHEATKLVAARRMAFELPLAATAAERGVATRVVCGGAQLINVALGGSLIQDIETEVPGARRHTRSPEGETLHEVDVAAGTRLAAIVGAGRLETNSSHHQAVARPAEGLAIVARAAEDGIVEAVEREGRAFLLGVQWHPERLLDRDVHVALFRALVAAARGRAQCAGR